MGSNMIIEYNQKKITVPANSRLYVMIKDLIEPKGGRNDYPDLFDKFWEAYPKGGRVDKKPTYMEWKTLEPKDQGRIHFAAAAYCAEIKLNGTPKSKTLHAKRFINTGRWESYMDAVVNETALKLLDQWDLNVRTLIGYAPAWKQEDRDLAVADIERLGPALWEEKIWLFFYGKDPNVEQEKRKIGIHYKSFHSMLTTLLANSRKRRPERCKYCGGEGGHEPGCPVAERRRAEKEKEMAELMAAKDSGISLTEQFKKSIGRTG